MRPLKRPPVSPGGGRGGGARPCVICVLPKEKGSCLDGVVKWFLVIRGSLVSSCARVAEYRVKPGEYCRDSTDCIQGLECEEFKCRCPINCWYDQRREVCDCGKVESEMGPVILGIFLGLFVIIFWCRRIKRTIRKHKEKMRQFSSLPADDNERVPPSYALSPVRSSIQTDTTVDDTASPASRTAGTPITEDTGTSATYSSNPPTALNNLVNPESDKPPSYVEIISSPPPSYIEVISSPLYNPDPKSQPVTIIPNTQYPNSHIPLSSSTQQSSSPSHSLSGRPHSCSSSPEPHHSSPLATPHSGSPDATLYPGSPDALLNSSAPAGAASSSSPSHSVPEAPPAYNSCFNKDSAPDT
ncbi:LOW QUALITY PROTEIN: anti-sigma-I factor RsgI2-like [Penaeus monodon]|uniref:LOW QUALITY PROTEIN: anti-sigma-I factor RsgI2-like n=1 Tax=Penaeus monodon TaxID=6687 RepID=UPI0018A7750E|nr:LOW QUALITY PROTEIN: anti-sigma-I factor RsgI2-like [Penaeus monodon]